LHHYHHRAFYLAVVCVGLVAVGLLALNFPVFLDAYDQWGFQVKCGTGYISDLSQAASVAGQHTYVDQCETALMLRRLWTIPLVVVGTIVLVIVGAVAATVWGRESMFGEDSVA
jgi:uncharacterized membrane protein YiaA